MQIKSSFFMVKTSLWVYGFPTRTATCAAAIGKNRRGVGRDDPSGKKSRRILRRTK